MRITAPSAFLAEFDAALDPDRPLDSLRDLLRGTGAPSARDMEPMLAGRGFGTMCLSEPQAGSSLSDISTRAVPDVKGDGTPIAGPLVPVGTKCVITEKEKLTDGGAEREGYTVDTKIDNGAFTIKEGDASATLVTVTNTYTEVPKPTPTPTPTHQTMV